jgi:hypothetical protein
MAEKVFSVYVWEVRFDWLETDCLERRNCGLIASDRHPKVSFAKANLPASCGYEIRSQRASGLEDGMKRCVVYYTLMISTPSLNFPPLPVRIV